MEKVTPNKPANVATKPALQLALLYLAVGVLWVFVTDYFLDRVIGNKMSAGLTYWQTYKGWLFFLLSATVIFYISRKFLASLYKNEQALHQSQLSLQVTLDNIPSTFVIYDPDLRFKYLNRRGLALSGKTLEELVGRRDEEVLPEISTCNYLPLLRKARDTGEAQSGECQVVAPDKSLLTAVVTYVPMKNSEGHVQQILGVTHDITERKLAEEALRAREEEFRLLADNLPGLVYSCQNDADFSVIYVSSTSDHILGVSDADMTSGKVTFKQLIHPDDYVRIVEQVDAALADKKPYHLVYRIVTPLGQLRWVDDRGLGTFRGNKLEWLQGFITDVTAEVKAQKEGAVLSVLAQDLAAADTVEKLGEALVTAVDSLWRCDAFLLSVRQSGAGVLRSVIDIDTVDGVRQRGERARYSSSLPPALVKGESQLILRDQTHMGVDTGPRFGDVSRPSMSLMYVPLQTAARKLGLLTVQSYELDAYANEDLNLLRRIADSAAPALERCRAEERSRAFSLLGEQLSAVVTSQEAAQIIVKVADELIGWDACALYLSSIASETVHRLIAYDIVDGKRTMLEEDDQVINKNGLLLRSYQEGQLLILRTAPADVTEFRPFGDHARPSASLIWVSMRGTAGIIGALTIQSYTVNAYDDEDVQLVQALANHCSTALERTRAEQDLKAREERYRFAITTAGAVPYQLNYQTKEYDFVGEGIELMTGWPLSEFSAGVWRSMIQEVVPLGTATSRDYLEVAEEVRAGILKSWQADIRILTRSGESRWISDTSIEIPDAKGDGRGSLGILHDITDRKETERQLVHTALHDPLTGLANRALLLDHLQQALHRAARRDNSRFAVLFIDLDRFKTVNDSLGHIMGDRLLLTVAQRLKECVRPGDTVARFAGDEFVLLLDDIRHREDVIPVAERVLQQVAKPLTLSGQEVFVSASIGIAFSSAAYLQPEELLRDADNALYIAKSRGKARYDFFDASMHEHAVTALELENDLRRALDRGELSLHYQPIVDLGTGRISHFEALLRWNHPLRGYVPPDKFIPVAEEAGLIIAIGYWVFEQAAQQLSEWDISNPQDPPLEMSVNLSVRQFAVPNLDQRLIEIVTRHGLEPNRFKLEITESTLMEKRDSITGLLTRLKDAGFGLSLDDFGTGYSSLSYLHQFPIDRVKIDRSFVSRMDTPGPEQEIIRSIILLAHSLRLTATAEGVETKEQLDLLQQMKCTCIQGWYFSKALPADEATALLSSGARLEGEPEDFSLL